MGKPTPPLNHFPGKTGMFYVYVIQAIGQDGRFYIGRTGDLRRRLAEHNAGKSNHTKGSRWRLVYYEAYASAPLAAKRERRLKHDGRARRQLMERIRE